MGVVVVVVFSKVQNWRFGVAGVWSGASARLVFWRLGNQFSICRHPPLYIG